MFGKDGARTVAFKFDQDSADDGEVPDIKAGHASIESLKLQEEAKSPLPVLKAGKWWEKVSELDITVQASFIGFAV